jgi:hypothetical protein
MNGVFGGPGDNIKGPQGKYSGGGFGGFTEENPTNIVGPPEGSGWDPTDETHRKTGGETHRKNAGKKGASKSSDAPLTWEKRVLRLLTGLQAEKGFKELPPGLKAEVSALISGAPDDAYS